MEKQCGEIRDDKFESAAELIQEKATTLILALIGQYVSGYYLNSSRRKQEDYDSILSALEFRYVSSCLIQVYQSQLKTKYSR